MPVIVVTAPAPAAAAHALVELNTAVAAALELPAEAVHSVLVVAAAGATGRQPGPAWPTAILHGSERPAPAMRAALEAATSALARSWDVDADQTWVQWQVRDR